MSKEIESKVHESVFIPPYTAIHDEHETEISVDYLNKDGAFIVDGADGVRYNLPQFKQVIEAMQDAVDKYESINGEE